MDIFYRETHSLSLTQTHTHIHTLTHAHAHIHKSTHTHSISLSLKDKPKDSIKKDKKGNKILGAKISLSVSYNLNDVNHVEVEKMLNFNWNC